MSVEFSDLSAWIARIGTASGIAYVGGAANLQSALEDRPARLPAAYVVPEASARAEPDDISSLTVSDGQGVSVYIAIANRNDMTGEASLSALRAARQAVADVLDEWQPDGDYDREVRWQTGALEAFDSSVLWWSDIYSYGPIGQI